MNRERLLYIVLSIIGIGALTAYLVACRPSWSPDGSKVLFPYLNAKAKQAGIALYDKNTRKTQSVFSKPADVGTAAAPFSWPWAQWDREGKRVIVLWVVAKQSNSELHVHVMRTGVKKPDRTFVLPDVEIFPGIPLPEADGGLFVGGDLLTRMDLETGKVQRRKPKGAKGVVLIGHRKQIYYCCEVPPDPKRYEIGTLDPKELSLRPALKLQQEDVGEITPLIGVAKDGSAIAIAGEKEGKYRILIVAGDKLQRTIPLELPSETHTLGNLEWSPDGKTIYAAFAGKVKDQDRCQLGIAEIVVETGALRVTPLLRIRMKNMDRDVLPIFHQIALSPDGKTIAASPTYFWEQLEDEKDSALYLVDLTTPDRKVTKIPPPAPENPNR